MQKIPFILATNYNADCSWIKDYTDEYILYDRSEFPSPLATNIVPNIGNADYDKLTYLVDHYHELPETFLWTKSNIFKYISKEEFDALKDNKEFTPLLTQHHKTYEPVCHYKDGMYYEINNSWYLNTFPARFFADFSEWASFLGIENPDYIPFAPGGSYIHTRERIHRYSRRFYDKMRVMLPYTVTPGEAQLCERSYYLLWK